MSSIPELYDLSDSDSEEIYHRSIGRIWLYTETEYPIGLIFSRLESAIFTDDAILLSDLVMEHRVNVNNVVIETLLMIACRNGNLECVRCLLVNHAADPNKAVDSFTPLMMACRCKKKHENICDIVDILLAYNATINNADKNGVTACMRAVKNNHLGPIRRMFSNVWIMAMDNKGRTAITYAIIYKRWKIALILLEERNRRRLEAGSLRNGSPEPQYTAMESQAEGQQIDQNEAMDSDIAEGNPKTSGEKLKQLVMCTTLAIGVSALALYTSDRNQALHIFGETFCAIANL